MTNPSQVNLRIAVVCEFPTLLGGERSLLAIVPNLRAKGCELVWLAPESGPLADELRRRGCVHIPFTIRDSLGKLLPPEAVQIALNGVIDQVQPALLHGNSLTIARWLGRCAESLTIPTTGHLRDIVKLSRSAVDDLNRNARLIAVSQATRDFHVDQGVDPARITVVHNGVDIPETSTNPLDLRQELGLPHNAFLVATIGQIGLRKGQTVLADGAVALEQLVSTSPPGNREIHYLLIGERYSDKAESREFDEQITSTIERAGLQQRFHRLGYRNDVPKILRQVDLVVHPARQEPLGRVLLEAAAAGRAIIATDVGGTREILTHEVSALLMPPDDPQLLARLILRLLNDESLRIRLGAGAREVVQSRFTVPSCATGCLCVWREAIETFD